MELQYIEDANCRELDWFLKESETFLKTVNEPELGFFLAESPNVIERALSGGYQPVKCLIEKKDSEELPKFLKDKAFEGIPVYSADYSILSKIRGFEMTRGAICIMKRRPLRALESVLEGVSAVAILENVMNPTNLGAIFRSAAAMGIECVLLSKGCADPLFKRAGRVSMGTVFQVPWTFVDNVPSAIDILKSKSFLIYSLALMKDAVSIDDPQLKENEKVAMILGTEAFGICDETIEKSDYSVIIPMQNGVDSLNVAAASAVAFYEIMKRKPAVRKEQIK